MKIQSLGGTTTTDDGVVLVMLEAEMPTDCVVIFIKKEDYPTLLKLIKESE